MGLQHSKQRRVLRWQLKFLIILNELTVWKKYLSIIFVNLRIFISFFYFFSYRLVVSFQLEKLFLIYFGWSYLYIKKNLFKLLSYFLKYFLGYKNKITWFLTSLNRNIFYQRLYLSRNIKKKSIVEKLILKLSKFWKIHIFT